MRNRLLNNRFKSRASRARWLSRQVDLASALVTMVADEYRYSQRHDALFRERADPWRYSSEPAELGRYRIAIELLRGANGAKQLGHAFEIGCAEGHFTELLANVSQSVIAVDYSRVAVERCRERVAQLDLPVEVRNWDLRSDPMPGSFDAVIAMDVLGLLRRPRVLRLACEKVIAGLVDRGLFLVTNEREKLSFEERKWGARLLRGGKRIVELLNDHPTLQLISAKQTIDHWIALFRKVEST